MVALGGVLRSATADGPQGLTVAETLPQGREPEVAFSGPWAQARWRAGRRPTQAEVFDVLHTTGCRDDRMLRAAGGISSGVGVTPLIERCWPAVVKVAQQLYRNREVTHRHVCAALGLPDDGGLGSVELALIRSGSTPGSFTVSRPSVPA